MNISKAICLALATGLLAGCAPVIPPDVFQLAPQSIEKRQLETRQYETEDESKILAACAGVLQDLGFTLEESETPLGLIVASKDRSAVDKGQVAGATFIVLLAAASGTTSNALDLVDSTQKIRASIVTAKSKDPKKMSVRVTFQRIVWNRIGQLSRVETMNDPVLYQGFFEKLSKAVFLEAQNI